MTIMDLHKDSTYSYCNAEHTRMIADTVLSFYRKHSNYTDQEIYDMFSIPCCVLP